MEAQRGEETHPTPHSRKVAELGLSPHVSRASPCTFPYKCCPFLSSPLPAPCWGLATHLHWIQTLKDIGPCIPPPGIFFLTTSCCPWSPRQAPSSASISAPLKAATKGLFMARGCHMVSVLSIAATEKNRDRSLRINSLPRLQHLTAPVTGPVPGGLPALISSNPYCNTTRTTSCVCSRDSEIHVTKR